MSEPIITAAELIAWQNSELKKKDALIAALRTELGETDLQRRHLAKSLNAACREVEEMQAALRRCLNREEAAGG